MEKRIVTGMSVFLLSFSLLMAQEVPAGIITAFKKGSSQELGKHLGDKVSLIILGVSSNLDRQKATDRMKSFFAEYKVSGFSVNHQGEREESSFLVGTLTTQKGNFRINCYLKKTANQSLIHQIRIDKVNE